MKAVQVADKFPLVSNLNRYFGCDRNLTPTLKAMGIWFPFEVAYSSRVVHIEPSASKSSTTAFTEGQTINF